MICSKAAGLVDKMGQEAEPGDGVYCDDAGKAEKFGVVEKGYLAFHLTDRFFDGHGV